MNAIAHQHLDEILRAWHRWMRSYTPSIGYAPKAAGFGMYRASRQYDTDNGALDDDADTQMSEAVDREVSRMQDPHRSAIHQCARNLYTDRNVWVSARVVASGRDPAQVQTEARQMLWARLLAAGMVETVREAAPMEVSK